MKYLGCDLAVTYNGEKYGYWINGFGRRFDHEYLINSRKEAIRGAMEHAKEWKRNEEIRKEVFPDEY